MGGSFSVWTCTSVYGEKAFKYFDQYGSHDNKTTFQFGNIGQLTDN